MRVGFIRQNDDDDDNNNNNMVHSMQATHRSESEGRYLIICHRVMKDTVLSRVDTVSELRTCHS